MFNAVVGVYAAVLFVAKGASGATLTAISNQPCVHGSTNMPVAATGTVQLTCATTASVSDILAQGAAIEFNAGGAKIFELPTSATLDTEIASVDTTNFGQGNLASTTANNNLVVTVTNVPSTQVTNDWNCNVVAGGTVAVEASSGNLDLTAYCKDFTAGTYCGSGVQALTCTTSTYQLSAWSADATAKLNFRKGATVKYTLSASNINTGVTTGNLDGTNTGTWSASATTATMVTFTPATAIVTADLGNDWTCDISDATGTFNGASATGTITTTACAAYTLSATCTGTTVSTLSIGTTGLDFATFAAGSAFTITVSKGTEERYKLTSDNVAATATTGSLDAAALTVVGGTYAVDATTSTTWTFTPTAAIAEADEGSDWRVVVVAGANGGGSGSVSVTCGAEMNKMAGMLVALLVAVKTLLF